MEWIISLICACVTVVGSISVAALSGRRSTAVIAERVEELTREVREHNNFARRMPVAEQQIKAIEKRLENIEKKIWNLEQAVNLN